MVTTLPAAGAVIATVGGEFATVTFIGAEVAVVPVESNTVAVSDVAPAAVGVQANEYGAAVTAAPSVTPLARNVTEVTVFPRLAAGDAVMVVAVPTVAVELFAGAVMDILVAATAVTVIAADVAVAPVLSIARAVMLEFPAAVGVHEME